MLTMINIKKMVLLKKKEYTFTEEEIDVLTKIIVDRYSRKKFTEDDLKRMINNNGNPRKKKNSSKTGFHLYMEKVREDNKGEKQSKLFIQGGNTWNEMSENEKKDYLKKAEEMKKKEMIKKEEIEEDDTDNYERMYLKCKKNDKVWMYRVLDTFTLEIMEGILGNKLKKEIKNFNDEDQLECYLNKQINLKRKKGYEYENN